MEKRTLSNGRSVTLYSTGVWFYDDSEVDPDHHIPWPMPAQEHDGHWFLPGTGVAVSQ